MKRTLWFVHRYRLRTRRDAAHARRAIAKAGAGAAGGALWGGLIGLIFLAPLLGAAIGAGVGAASGALTDLGIDDNRALIERDAHGTLSVRANPRGDDPIVVIASERMDPDPGWQDVGVGELIHVGPGRGLDRQTLLTEPPRHPMVLSARAERSQAYERDD